MKVNDKTMTDAIEVIYSADRRRRVVILRGPDNHHTYREEASRSGPDGGERWVPLWNSPSYYDSLEAAKREVVHNVSWLASERSVD